MGLAYRLTNVTFESLTYNGQPFGMRHMLRSEPSFIGRVGSSYLQLQVATGLSLVPNYSNAKGYADTRYVRDIKDSSWYTSVGLVFYPHRLPKHSKDK
ncbi:hypothetical protein [Hymenobacter sp. BT491]|uniref:hypothetical protein n=1 Tax=Hymenobacter sp. BT491 TaxID=2766779 RepID=UPI001653DE2C|nr:hypothetical protein [Hymenobacter sp. BT491]MBC6988140.1 hypothetical protein [Hymenobacter sp. BT491]